AHAAAFLTASYWLTAWERSKTLTSHLPRHAAGSAAPPPSAPRNETTAAWIASVLGAAFLLWVVVVLVRRATRG
ncbi:MAG: hypothetical protein N3D11_15370, partial [Candidatus Sumerlaeia bacterium]|nr:hypothetical protein [Candidatus Sumerlaeia bacterium]